MGKYLKKFNSHSEYETFKQSQQYIEPNVSVCVGEHDIHYNPIAAVVHEYVDLGLPSGTLWATENIKDAIGNDLYFAWGETQGYTSGQVGTDKNFNWNIWLDYPVDYAFGAYDYDDETNYGMTKYNKIDNKTVLDATDDAATVNWGPDWVMPTKEQFDELVANTTTVFTEEPPYGLVFTSVINNNTLFLPFGGSAKEGYAYGEETEGTYWSRSRYVPACPVSYEMSLESSGPMVSNDDRCRGCTIRPVHV